MTEPLPLVSSCLPSDGRKWLKVCEQRQTLAKRLAAVTKSKIVCADVDSLAVGFTRRTFFRRMADLRKLGLLQSIGRLGYSFDPSAISNLAPIKETDRKVSAR
jgi:hypothetical protein